jgi:hypothetical protein
VPLERTFLLSEGLLHKGNDQCGSHSSPGAALTAQSRKIVCAREALTLDGGRITNSSLITTIFVLLSARPR